MWVLESKEGSLLHPQAGSHWKESRFPIGGRKGNRGPGSKGSKDERGPDLGLFSSINFSASP